MIGIESLISGELSRCEVEKREMGGVFPGRYPYGDGNADLEEGSSCLGGYLVADDPVLAATTTAMTRTGSWAIPSMMRAA